MRSFVAAHGRRAMTVRPQLLIATHSAHKLAELRELLRVERGALVSLDDLGIRDDPDETGLTFATNARIKARFGARRTGLPTLADDSGLEVDALDGGPGVRTRRYAGENASDTDNNARLLEALHVQAVEAAVAGGVAKDERVEQRKGGKSRVQAHHYTL